MPKGSATPRSNTPRAGSFLAARDQHAVEEMDKPDCDLQVLARTYAQFPLVNRVVSRWHSVYQQLIKPLLSSVHSTSLLDIGCGGGDIATSLAKWAARDGLVLSITAIDPDVRAIDFALAHATSGSVNFRDVHSGVLVAEGAVFDVVISNHILHHLAPAEFQSLLADSALLARQAVIHSDISRSRVAYTLFSVGTLPFFPGSFIRRDGLTSIRRSYTAAELRTVVPPGWRVESGAPWRNLLLFTPEQQHV